VLSDREILAPEDLPAEVLKGGNGNEIAGALDLEEVARWVLDHASYSASAPLLDRLEKEIARQLVDRIGVIAQAARLLGVSRPTLYSKLKS
jgi:transcriptional regulator of acetoin/glycerol metabolism